MCHQMPHTKQPPRRSAAITEPTMTPAPAEAVFSPLALPGPGELSAPSTASVGVLPSSALTAAATTSKLPTATPCATHSSRIVFARAALRPGETSKARAPALTCSIVTCSLNTTPSLRAPPFADAASAREATTRTDFSGTRRERETAGRTLATTPFFTFSEGSSWNDSCSEKLITTPDRTSLHFASSQACDSSGICAEQS